MLNHFEILTDTLMGMTYEEVEKSASENAVVLFPVGVIEAHGPHLPVGTDIFSSINQAVEMKRFFDKEKIPCVVAPPFYFGGTQAMTRQFVGTFTSSEDTIVSSIKDILASLARFGFKRVVVLNAHGDSLQKKAIIRAIMESNEESSMKTYWPEYADDLEWAGFKGDEDYLLKIDPFQLEQAFDIDKWPDDEFDVHASAFETALMLDICPEMVRTEKIEGLQLTMLKGDERWKWNEGNIENISLVPRAYVGDPAGYKYIHAHMEKVYEAYAKSLVKFFMNDR